MKITKMHRQTLGVVAMVLLSDGKYFYVVADFYSDAQALYCIGKK